MSGFETLDPESDKSKGSPTPRPWELRENKIVHYGESGTFIVSVVSNQTKRNRADSQLIAAAPDLLAALELARSWVALRLGDSHEDLQMIDAALVKARGQ